MILYKIDGLCMKYVIGIAVSMLCCWSGLPLCGAGAPPGDEAKREVQRQALFGFLPEERKAEFKGDIDDFLETYDADMHTTGTRCKAEHAEARRARSWKSWAKLGAAAIVPGITYGALCSSNRMSNFLLATSDSWRLFLSVLGATVLGSNEIIRKFSLGECTAPYSQIPLKEHTRSMIWKYGVPAMQALTMYGAAGYLSGNWVPWRPMRNDKINFVGLPLLCTAMSRMPGMYNRLQRLQGPQHANSWLGLFANLFCTWHGEGACNAGNSIGQELVRSIRNFDTVLSRQVGLAVEEKQWRADNGLSSREVRRVLCDRVRKHLRSAGAVEYFTFLYSSDELQQQRLQKVLKHLYLKDTGRFAVSLESLTIADGMQQLEHAQEFPAQALEHKQELLPEGECEEKKAAAAASIVRMESDDSVATRITDASGLPDAIAGLISAYVDAGVRIGKQSRMWRARLSSQADSVQTISDSGELSIASPDSESVIRINVLKNEQSISSQSMVSGDILGAQWQVSRVRQDAKDVYVIRSVDGEELKGVQLPVGSQLRGIAPNGQRFAYTGSTGSPVVMERNEQGEWVQISLSSSEKNLELKASDSIHFTESGRPLFVQNKVVQVYDTGQLWSRLCSLSENQYIIEQSNESFIFGSHQGQAIATHAPYRSSDGPITRAGDEFIIPGRRDRIKLDLSGKDLEYAVMSRDRPWIVFVVQPHHVGAAPRPQRECYIIHLQ